jgi:hypothetical protein
MLLAFPQFVLGANFDIFVRYNLGKMDAVATRKKGGGSKLRSLRIMDALKNERERRL